MAVQNWVVGDADNKKIIGGPYQWDGVNAAYAPPQRGELMTEADALKAGYTYPPDAGAPVLAAPAATEQMTRSTELQQKQEEAEKAKQAILDGEATTPRGVAPTSAKPATDKPVADKPVK